MTKSKFNSFLLLLILGLTLIFSPLNIHAASNSIERIDVTVDLMKDASANIAQVWQATVSEGTEFYIPQTGLGNIEITDFQVSDANYGPYENIGNWDVDASFEEKAGKCGINITSKGLELCWGKTSFGENTYTLTYTMTNFVKEYADGAFGFYSRFLNLGMNPAPDAVSITIRQDGANFSTDNAGIWGFGFNGEIGFTDDGKVSATSNEPFTKSNHATILMRLDKSLITNAAPSDMTFAKVQEMALDGSDYEEDSSIWGEIIMIIVVAVVLLGSMGLFGSYKKAGDKSIAPPLDEKNLAYYRDIPYKGYLPAAFYVLDNYKKLNNKSDLISAYFLSWIKSGSVTVETRAKKTFLGLGAKTATSLVFHEAPPDARKLEKSLYDIMIKAAGSDGVLQESELQTWSSNNHATLSTWFDSATQNGLNYYQQNKLLTNIQQPYAFNMLKRTVTAVNDAGLQENKNLFGFKKYLQDYTLIKDRSPNEVQLWDDYLVFASLFGIADQVANDFKQINPQFFEASEYQQNSGDYDFFTTYLFLNALSNASYRGMEAGNYSSNGTRSGGGGGFTSLGGGGGGFSGGGFGGGSR